MDSLTGHVSNAWLKEHSHDFALTKELIDGVVVKELRFITDGRGAVIERWSEPWIESDGLVATTHSYTSITDYMVSKGWHLHPVHIDQLTCIEGKLQIVLVDTRLDSPTYGAVNSIILGTNQPRLVKIPNGVMHGWKALSAPTVSVTNYQSAVYDAKDELKFDCDPFLPEVWEPKNG